MEEGGGKTIIKQIDDFEGRSSFTFSSQTHKVKINYDIHKLFSLKASRREDGLYWWHKLFVVSSSSTVPRR